MWREGRKRTLRITTHRIAVVGFFQEGWILAGPGLHSRLSATTCLLQTDQSWKVGLRQRRE